MLNGLTTVSWRTPTRALLVLFLLTLMGCGDDPVTTGGTGDDDPNDPNDPNNPNNNSPHLVLISAEDPVISFSEQTTIEVQYLDGTDTAVPNAFLNFAIDGAASDTTLSGQNSSTDDTGSAEITVNAGVQVVDFNVVVSVLDNDTVDPLTVRVRVQPKDVSDYILRVSYGGPIRLHEASVALYTTERSCEDLTASPTAAPSSDSAFQSLTVRPDAEGNFQDHSFAAPESATFTYAVARGEPRGDDATDGRGYFVTFGCSAEIGAVTPGTPTVIEVSMDNLYPATVGTYSLESEVNLVDAIPDDAQETVDAIIGIFDSPGLGILKLVAVAYNELNPDDDCVEDCEYWERSPFGSLLSMNGDGEIVASGIGGPVVSIVDAMINGYLEDAETGSFTDTIGNIVEAIRDLLDNAQNFTLVGDLVINEEADADGELADITVRFNQINLDWDGDVYNFFIRGGVLIDGLPADEDAENITGRIRFDPANDEGYALELDAFGVNIHYGDLIIWLIEDVVFPRFLTDSEGAPMDSFEDFFASIIDCVAIGESVDTEVGFGGSAVAAACNSFQDVAVAALEDFVRSQSADIGNFVRLATPEAAPCGVGFSDTANEFVINGFGTADEMCEWDGEVQTAADAEEAEDLEGYFWGERL